MSAPIVFLHGLESRVNEQLVPIGRKATHLSTVHQAVCPALDTRAAIATKQQAVDAGIAWNWPFTGYEDAFETPLARAREAIGPQTRLVIGSSFGGAVLLRLLHEEVRWSGPALFLAAAGLAVFNRVQ